jgi:hypothetical protein
MDLKQLQARGGFVPPTPVSTETSWTYEAEDGNEVTDTFTVRIKKHSQAEIERLYADFGKDPKISYTAALIAASVFWGDEGEARVSYDEAFKMVPSLTEALAEAIDKVNPIKKRKGASKN